MATASSASTGTTTATLRAIGFCGVDDSIHENLLGIIAKAYPLVEFGVLFRPDKEGQPRYPTTAWVERLSRVVKQQKSDNNGNTTTNNTMRLAAHLCGSRVDELLQMGDDTFLKTCYDWGFRRVQINATAVNGVNVCNHSMMEKSVAPTLLRVIRQHPELEFIIQCNQETQPLWQGLLDLISSSSSVSSSSSLVNNDKRNNGGDDDEPPPSNLSFLMDESKGTGLYSGFGNTIITTTNSRSKLANYNIGYAGGIGPHNITQVLHEIIAASAVVANNGLQEQLQQEEEEEVERRSVLVPFWIDMESSLRSKILDPATGNERDIFDVSKCYEVIDAICAAGLCSHPTYLPS